MGKEQIEVETASPQDLSAVTAMLDQEFIHNRQREISFASRFPGTYSLDNIENIYIVKENGRVVSSTIIKQCKWQTADCTYLFGMIGGVCTEPWARGRGLASTLLRHTEAVMKEQGLDFIVLWTTLVPFYERLGWHLLDQGLFGSLQQKIPMMNESIVSYGQLVPEDVEYLEAIRVRQQLSRIIRQPIDYQTIPLPAQNVERFIVKTGSDFIAYAIVGRLNHTGYVYEVVGDSITFPVLWSAIGRAYPTVYINDCSGSPCAHWLDSKKLVHWAPQRLYMGRVLSSRLSVEQLGSIYISLLDRI